MTSMKFMQGNNTELSTITTIHDTLQRFTSTTANTFLERLKK